MEAIVYNRVQTCSVSLPATSRAVRVRGDSMLKQTCFLDIAVKCQHSDDTDCVVLANLAIQYVDFVPEDVAFHVVEQVVLSIASDDAGCFVGVCPVRCGLAIEPRSKQSKNKEMVASSRQVQRADNVVLEGRTFGESLSP